MKSLRQAAASKSTIFWMDSILKTFKQDDSNNEVTASGGGEQIDDILDGLVGAVIGGFDSNNEVTGSGGGEQIDDILDGLVGAVIGGFESAVWAMLGVWSVMEAAVGKWSAQPFVEEQK
jgi:hypothetical protein